MIHRDWAAESLALLRRERRRLDRLLAGERPGDEGLSDETEAFIAGYDAWQAQRKKEAPPPAMQMTIPTKNSSHHGHGRGEISARRGGDAGTGDRGAARGMTLDRPGGSA